MLTNQASRAADFPANWRTAERERTLTFDLNSKITGQKYRILIGLPAHAAPKDGYPVLWALDGLASFPIIETVRPQIGGDQRLWRQGRTPNDGLIVAVAYASGKPFDIDARSQDYTPVTTAKTGDLLSSKHGGADDFLRFLISELRPLIAQQFAINPQQQTLFGFSYGGLFALYTLSTQPQYFQRYWAASPSLWFGEAQTLKRLPEQLTKLETMNLAGYSAKVTITVGLDEQYPSQFSSPFVEAKSGERAMVDNAQAFAQQLASYNDGAKFDVSFDCLPAHDHMDMLLHGARRVVDFAFSAPVSTSEH
ncbi:alpha/beta hydrolase-fold protein [Chitinibacter sp. SCUT-21]|uniref:alpha/beta hydrolase n=1 Tax=Chitinibacter sp. SCUT-21 TaxID=2970891 RepID=UPI0035A6C6ED